MQLNADKIKEMVTSFPQIFHSGHLPALTLEGKEPERIASAKILGVYGISGPVVVRDLS